MPLKKIRKGKLSIKINTNDDLLYINIEDNGIGRSNNKNNLGNIKESKGMSITQQRIHNINNYYDTTRADIFYTDLLDDFNNPMGIRVTIILPVNLKDI